MTGKDKTEDQLLTSIRKNKPAASAAPRKKTAKKAAPRKATAARREVTQKAEPTTVTDYQSGRRVWPD